MGIFEVRQASTGTIMWTGGAENEQQALDAMAREAGYRDYASIPTEIRSGDLQASRLPQL